MRKLLIPLLASLALPTEVNAESYWLLMMRSSGMEKIEMKENSNQKEIPFSSLHVEYHQILQKSVSSNDFSMARAALNSIERLNNIEKGLSVEWGDKEWEIDLKKKLSNAQKPETKLDQILER